MNTETTSHLNVSCNSCSCTLLAPPCLTSMNSKSPGHFLLFISALPWTSFHLNTAGSFLQHFHVLQNTRNSTACSSHLYSHELVLLIWTTHWTLPITVCTSMDWYHENTACSSHLYSHWIIIIWGSYSYSQLAHSSVPHWTTTNSQNNAWSSLLLWDQNHLKLLFLPPHTCSHSSLCTNFCTR